MEIHRLENDKVNIVRYPYYLKKCFVVEYHVPLQKEKKNLHHKMSPPCLEQMQLKQPGVNCLDASPFSDLSEAVHNFL